MSTLKNQLNTVFTHALDKISGSSGSNAHVITASRPEFGDYQVNGVMALAKQLKRNPREIAAEVVNAVQVDQAALIESLEIAGPGFINVTLNTDYLREQASSKLHSATPSWDKVSNPQRVVVDYSSPNLAKEMHVGHLRGTIIGDCLARVMDALGHTVVRQNHVGDWGTQFGMLITHMQDSVSSESAIGTQLADLETFYREAKQRFDEDADFANRARQSVVKLQSGDPEYVAVWEQFIEESLSHCQALYDKLHVTLTREDLAAESFYNDALPGVVSTLEEKGLLTESEGAHCVFLEQFKGKDGDPLPVIIQKKDGGYLYATTDLAAVDYRSHQLQADRSLYVVDARQSLHFQQVFAVAREAGFASDNISLEHIAYGTMMGSDGKPFKTRSGDTIKLIDLLDEAVRRARALVAEKSPELSASEMDEIAEVVGIAAVKYADLSKNRTSDYVFDWSTMLSFEGNTAPYLLYAYARIQSVLRRASVDLDSLELGEELSAEERALLIKNMQLPEAVHALANDCFPNQLCNFLYELAGSYMSFYEACPILKADGKTQQSRLALCQLTAHSLRDGLLLLGITPLNKM